MSREGLCWPSLCAGQVPDMDTKRADRWRCSGQPRSPIFLQRVTRTWSWDTSQKSTVELSAKIIFRLLIRKVPTPIKIKLALPPPPPPSKKLPRPPLKGGILWAWRFSSRKSPKMPGAHKIGAASSGPRIAGGNFMDITLFLMNQM